MRLSGRLDREVIERLRFTNKDEQKCLLEMLSKSRHESGVTLALAIFRDVFMFRNMVNTEIINMQMEIESLRNKILELENK